MGGNCGRRHISWKKRCAIFALALGDVPYDDAKQMTEDQILSLYQLDHDAILHDSKHPDREKYWNYKPRLIKDHREKTKRDITVITKGRRIRRKLAEHQRTLTDKSGQPRTIADNPVLLMAEALSAGLRDGARDAYDRLSQPLDMYSTNYNLIDWSRQPKRKIPSRTNPWPPKGSRPFR